MSQFQRKGWDNLSDGQRRRYERSGITKQSYDAGASLDKARGKEAERQLQRDLADWKARQRVFYGRKPREINASVKGLSKEELRALLKLQSEAETLFDPRIEQKDRPKTQAHALWKQRDVSLPEWMYYYHGYYS